MAYEGTHSTRTWREVATELSHEMNSDRMLELSKELLHALDLEKPRSQLKTPSENQNRVAH